MTLKIDITTRDAVIAVNKAISALDELRNQAIKTKDAGAAVRRFKEELEATTATTDGFPRSTNLCEKNTIILWMY